MTAHRSISSGLRNDEVRGLIRCVLPLVMLTFLFVALYPLRFHLSGSGDTVRVIFDFTTFVLALTALFFGYIQFVDAGRQTRKMEDVARSMSTRYLGEVPTDLEDIRDVVSKADHQFVAVASFVSFGRYVRPEAFDRFLQAVKEAKRNGVEIRLYIYDNEPATKVLESHFPKEEWVHEQNCDRFRAFFSFFPGIVQPRSHEDFLEMFRRMEDGARSELNDRGVKIYLLSSQERMFFWLGDNKDAVFSFDPMCFRTRDARLIETFRDIIESYESLPTYVENKKATKERQQLAKTMGPDINQLTDHSFGTDDHTDRPPS
jgi:hypothetical protein